MRMTTVQRAALSVGHWRLDPVFHLRHQRIRTVIDRDDAQHVPLADLVAAIQDGARLPAASAGIPILRLSNLRPCEVDLHDIRYVDGTSGHWPALRLGDVVFTRAAEPFRAAVISASVPTPMTISPEITVIRPRPAVLPEYLAAVLSTPSFAAVLRDLAYRSRFGAMQRLRLSDIQRLPLPLPRRSVQEEIRSAYITAEELTSRAREEFSGIVRAVHAEINARLPAVQLDTGCFQIRRGQLRERWDVSYACGRLLRETLATTRVMRPLFELARPVAPSLRGLDNDARVLAIQADDVNEATFLVEGAPERTLRDLSARMRQPLAVGDVLLCTTGAGQQVAFLDKALEEYGLPLLGSATFTALQFTETPRFFAVALTYPLVRIQLNLLMSGSVQRFVNQRALDELLVPTLGSVWREDFDSRMQQAMQHRREALAARASVLEAAEVFVTRRWEEEMQRTVWRRRQSW